MTATKQERFRKMADALERRARAQGARASDRLAAVRASLYRSTADDLDRFDDHVTDNGRLRAAMALATAELRADHRPLDYGKEPVGCVLCYPGDSSWPCSAAEVADDLHTALEVGP